MLGEGIWVDARLCVGDAKMCQYVCADISRSERHSSIFVRDLLDTGDEIKGLIIWSSLFQVDNIHCAIIKR